MAVKSMCSSHKQGLVVSEFQFQISRRKNEISSALGHMFTQFSSVAQSCPTLWTPWTAARQASLSIINSQRLLKVMSIESVMPSNHLILCHPLHLPLSIFPSIRVFSNESVLPIRWPQNWSFSFSISSSNEYSGLVSFRTDRYDLLAVRETVRVLSSTTVQFFSAQPSLRSNSHIHT